MYSFCRIIIKSDISLAELDDLRAHSRFIQKLNMDIENKKHSVAEKESRGFKIFPKLHHLVHYADQIKVFGPPSQSSMMPIERKHQDFKSASRTMKNFISIWFKTKPIGKEYSPVLKANWRSKYFDRGIEPRQDVHITFSVCWANDFFNAFVQIKI